MRYSLRNKKKIIKAFDETYFNRMVDSLNEFFEKNEKIELIKGDPYPFILVDDVGHTVNLFEFWVIKENFDVLNLAFKGIIG